MSEDLFVVLFVLFLTFSAMSIAEKAALLKELRSAHHFLRSALLDRFSHNVQVNPCVKPASNGFCE